MRPTSIITVVALVVAGGLVVKYLDRPSPRELAYRVCYDCGMSETEVDALVKTFTGAKQPREQLMELYRQTFDDPAKIDCEDCAEAILDAVGVPE